MVTLKIKKDIEFSKHWNKDLQFSDIDFISSNNKISKSTFDFIKTIKPKKIPFVKKTSLQSLKLCNILKKSIPLENYSTKSSKWISHYTQKSNEKKKAQRLLKTFSFENLQNKIFHSIVIIQAHQNNPNYENICNKFSQFFKLPTGLNIYITPARDQTFSKHFDMHNVFVLQICGKKKWIVYDIDPKTKKEIIILETILSPGDFLYIPTGFYHEAHAEEEMSVHFTFGTYAAPMIPLNKLLNQTFNPSSVDYLEGTSVSHFLFFLKIFEFAKKNNTYFIFKNENKKAYSIVNYSSQLNLSSSMKIKAIKFLKGKLSTKDKDYRILSTNLKKMGLLN